MFAWHTAHLPCPLDTQTQDAFSEDYVCGREDGSPATCRLMIKPIQHILKCVRTVGMGWGGGGGGASMVAWR